MAGTAEVSTSNLRSGASFDNLKATWGKALNIGDFKSDLECAYDYNGNKGGLKSASLSGNLIDGSGDDLSLDYEVKKNFGGDKTTEVTLTAEVSGSTITAEVPDGCLGVARGKQRNLAGRENRRRWMLWC